MKLKKINLPIFIVSTIAVVVLLIPAFIGAFGEDEGTLRPDDTVWNFFARLFYVLRFPTHTLLWPIIIKGGAITYFGGLITNCMFYGLIIERFISLFKRQKQV